MDAPSTTTLTFLLKKAAGDHPNRRALFVPGRLSISHSTLDRLTDEAASFLSTCGVRQGDVVSLTFPTTLEFVITFLAVIRCRAVAAPLNSAYTKEEFEFYLSDSESRVLIVNKEGNPSAEDAAANLRIPQATAVLPDDLCSCLQITPFSVRQPVTTEADGSTTPKENAPSDVALFLHTSGTTSRPKGVPLTQANLAASVRNIGSAYRLSPADSTLVVLPLFHVHGLVAALLSSLAATASVTLPAAGRFSASTFWADMRASDATWYTAVPTVHQILLDRHAARPEPSYPNLRFIRSCSSALAPAVLQRLEEVFRAPVVEAYAMTEAAHQMSTNPLEGEQKAGSVGKAAGVEMVVLGEQGQLCPPGVKGEVCVRGPNVTRGYKDNPEANRAAFQFGWFHTGDVGYMDSDGYLYLVGRIKELINRGGEKISPIEVDAVLLSHPDVAQAVAFAVPDEKYGEEINCAMIPRDGTKIDEVDVLFFARKNLAAFKVPKRVFTTDSLPKTATGKIQRRLVAEHFLSQISIAKVSKFGA